MKRVFIVHRWDANQKADWYPWLKEELEKEGFKTVVLRMPNPSRPKIDDWIAFLAKSIQHPDKDTYLIGHSVGCQAIVRYLEKNDVNIGGMVMVAGWFRLENLESDEERKIARPWLKESIDFKKARQRFKRMIALFSDDDPYVPLINASICRKMLGAEVYIEHGMGHYTQDDGIKKLPSALHAIMHIVQDQNSSIS